MTLKELSESIRELLLMRHTIQRMDYPMKFKDRWRELREAASLMQKRLAQNAGMSVGNVRNHEQDIRLPTFPVVVKLAKALGVTCEEFADCEDVAGEERTEERPAKRKPKKEGK